MSLTGGVLIALLLLSRGASSARSPASAFTEELDGCTSLRVRGLRDDGSQYRRRRLSATAIVDLELAVGLPEDLTGEHRLDVKLYTPDQHLYRTLTIAAYIPDATATRSSKAASTSVPARRKLEGVARPLEVQIAEPLRWRAGWVLRATVPVAGTSIVSSSLYGRWTAVAHLDGSTQPCVAPREFVIGQ